MKLNVLRSHCRTLAEFRQQANEMIAQINTKLSGGWTPFFQQDNLRLYTKISDVVKAYLAEKEKELRKATMICYRSFCRIFLEWVNANIPNSYASMFNRVHAVKYLDYIYNVRKVEARAWNNQLKMARAFFTWSFEKCYVKENPFDGIKTKRVKEKSRVLIPENVRKRIAKYFEGKQMLIVSELVFSSLIRPKEINLIQLKHIDIKQKTIMIPGENAKTHNLRFAPLSHQTIELLKKLNIEKYPSDFYLFGSNDEMVPAKKPRAYSRFRKEWLDMRIALGLPDEMQLYSLRDTGINAMLKAGIDPLSVMQAADHHDLAMTTRYANHADPDLINKVYQSAPEF